MKSIFVVAILLFGLSAYALSLEDIAGDYKITLDGVPVENHVSISETGELVYKEVSPYGEFNCTGTTTLEGSLLKSQMNCEEGATFEQTVNLEGVENFDKFVAPVFSTLYGQEFPMQFEKQK